MTGQTQTPEKPTVAVAKTDAERFTNTVIREFSGTVGKGVQMTAYQQRLAQHLFLKVDATLKELEAKRLVKNQQGTPIVWNNVNLNKLAIDAVHRVDLGLDALIPNHIHPIPYFNTKLSKYDLDLRIGYVGKDYYRRKVAREQPINIIYELVHESDKFTAIKKGLKHDQDSYEFEIVNPFDRGKVVGGFGYIMYEDPKKNVLVVIGPKQFNRSKTAAKTNDFWEHDEEAMQFKTLVHRVTDKLAVDPERANESYYKVEAEEAEADEGIIDAEIVDKANQGPVIGAQPGADSGNENQKKDEKKAEPSWA
ncbi:MAG: recombinase RecT [Dehalococcoidia bacterium]|nr:recombinase RecT [Dehalococcoidia bacterium]